MIRHTSRVAGHTRLHGTRPAGARVIATAITAVAAGLCLAAGTPSRAGAQLASQSPDPVTAPRMEVGGALQYAQPVSQFRQNVRHGFGGGGHFILGVDPARVFGLRVNADYVNYGNESQYVVVRSAFQDVQFEQRTSNNIVVASIGPQFTFPTGPVRPYVTGGVGVAYFYTQTSLTATDLYSNQSANLNQTTNFSDNSLAYTAEGGLYIPLQPTLLVDVGVRYNAIGKTRYLTRGDIAADPNNPNGVIITPHESDARFVTYRVGLALRF